MCVRGPGQAFDQCPRSRHLSHGAQALEVFGYSVVERIVTSGRNWDPGQALSAGTTQSAPRGSGRETIRPGEGQLSPWGTRRPRRFHRRGRGRLGRDDLQGGREVSLGLVRAISEKGLEGAGPFQEERLDEM
jgi:hypothetical protein